jgi:hypothetical protein
MIIGLCGYTGSGKDEIAKHLAAKHGFVRVAFADAIRQDLLKLNPWVAVGDDFCKLAEMVDDLGWDDAKRSCQEVRRLMQVYGTEVGRHRFGEECWLKRAESIIDNALINAFDVVVTDVRFANEVQFIQEWLGSQIWHVQRPGCRPINAHASEQLNYAAIANTTIMNDSTIENLHLITSIMLESACKSMKAS